GAPNSPLAVLSLRSANIPWLPRRRNPAMNVHLVQNPATEADGVRHDWTRAEAQAIHDLPFNDLLFRAASVQRRHFDPNKVQMARLLSIKTGGCAEDCGYCSQSA